MLMASDELSFVSGEFIEEYNKETFVRNTKSKNGGPYSKKDRFQRRQEIYRLHFECGLSAVRISTLLKINRNTINSDIKYWYSKLAKHWKELDIDALMMRQQQRLESQRTRLVEALNKKSLVQKLSVERLILEIDNKIMKNYLEVKYLEEKTFDDSLRILNRWCEQQNLDIRYIGKWNIMQTTEKKYDSIQKILKGQ